MQNTGVKRVAILMDGAFIRIKLKKILGRRIDEKDIVKFAHTCLINDEELFRIYYYDCQPFGEVVINPISRTQKDMSKTATYIHSTRLLNNLSKCENVAYRQGTLNQTGWELTREGVEKLKKQGPVVFNESDIKVNFNQKMVDMKIGLDIAWLSSKNIVDRIILITADSDFIPAMKFARREGIQIVLITMNHYNVQRRMFNHADFLREIDYSD